jgi:alpha-beta hydrolase superfamily lysophospholipase
MSRIAALVLVLASVGALATACSDGGSGSGQSSASTTAAGGRRVRLIAPVGLRTVLDRERRSRRESEATTTTPATTTTTPPSAPFPVAQLSTTFVDPSRGQPARDGTPAQSSRTITTTVWYPASAGSSPENPTPAASAGQFPLVVFAHGYAIDAAAYAALLHDIAMGGYVVAAPDFPGTSTAYAGEAVREDSLNQPGDISFVITSMQQLAQQPGPLHGAIAPDAVGVNGQSDGGVTAVAAGWNTCCQDPRIKAGAIYTGATFAFEGEWFPAGSPPIMFVHGTADEINGYGASTSMFERAQSPKYLLSIEGGTHLEPYVDPPWVAQVAAATVAFFDQYLKADPSAAQRLAAVGSQPGYSLQAG